MGKKSITFACDSATSLAEFYLNSTPAHKAYPIVQATVADANSVDLGSKVNCNERTIFQYIHKTGIQSCQLVMGITKLPTGSIWNTFPPHTHNR
ncbi:MAG: 4-deoxy-L-threo-5-hexosulose-uronate ketol-isomerase [Cyclobacteriaceae bacterium]|jgi:4-deoxy-L-threo-5-hexosulose-uronate ketol-isomerase